MSQFARVAWVIVAGFVGLELVVHLVMVHDQTVAGVRAYAVSVVDRALALDALLAEADVPERERLIAVATGSDFRASIQAEPPATAGDTWRHADDVSRDIAAHLERVGAARVDVALASKAITVTVPRTSGDYLVVTASGPEVATRARPALVGIVATGLVIGLVLWGTRRSTRHLPQFAAAAEALGRDAGAPALPEGGPPEVRRAAVAFNEMARRVRGYLDERTQMLAAVSHDIRTQLTRLALRTEHIADTEQRDRARDDVDQMTRLLDSVVAFAREDRADEAVVRLDLATLLTTLVDDERSLGKPARYIGPAHSIVEGRPMALRRAFTNLIDNALQYGTSADVTLDARGGQVVVDVADRGPGIPLEDRARVLLPFERVEQSRNRATGGAGLGLAIAHTVVLRHGGTLRFLEREGGGLVVRVEFEARRVG